MSGRIIGAALCVHETIGPGFIESIYEEALCVELTREGLQFDRQWPVKLMYRDQPIGEHRLDLLIERKVVVELKAIREFEPIHFAVVRSYLKAVDCDLGLLLNFATPTLSIKRVGREWHSRAE